MHITELPPNLLKKPEKGNYLDLLISTIFTFFEFKLNTGAKEGFNNLVKEELTKFGVKLPAILANLTSEETEAYGAILEEFRSFTQSPDKEPSETRNIFDNEKKRIQYGYLITPKKSQLRYEVNITMDISGKNAAGKYAPPLESISIKELPSIASGEIGKEALMDGKEKICYFKFTDGILRKGNYWYELGITTDPKNVSAIFIQDNQGRNQATIEERIRTTSSRGDEFWSIIKTRFSEVGTMNLLEGTALPRTVYFASNKSQNIKIR